MRILLTGVSGYVGAALVPRLRRDGHELVGLARDPARVEADVPVVRGDVITGEGLDEALAGVDVAYYLIHSMEPAANGAFPERELTGARTFAGAAERAGVERVIYLGGLVPAGARASRHLDSRLRVEELLLERLPAATVLRASIVIGARSRSFRFLVRLIERLPALGLPPWRTNRTQPIDGRDLLEYLARAATSDAVAGRSLDVAGPDVVTYGELVERIAEHMLVGRPTVRLGGVFTSPAAGVLAARVAGETPELIGPLMEGLESDLLPRDDTARKLLGVRLHTLDSAIERALREWEAVEPVRAR
jgi:uncharacterized protein YbjT (DUF2867 family)